MPFPKVPASVRRIAPGLGYLGGLDGPTALRDAVAGVSVAAVAIPIGLAFATLIGAPPVNGLYASLAPLAAYALFGPSRFLIVGPDPATCTLIAAALTQLAVIGPDRPAAAALLALLVGLGCILAAWLRLGFIANLLSKPILTGYMAGVAISLLISQLSGMTGVDLHAQGVVRPFFELARRWAELSWPTVALSVGLFVGIRALRRFAPRAPGAIIAVVLAVLLSWALHLQHAGVAVLGAVPQGLPAPRVPGGLHHLPTLSMAVAGLLIVSFSSGIVTARSFAEKAGARVDANRELIGFGAANLAAGLFQGFCVTGADSRTAVGLSAGGNSPLVGLTAAAVIALVLGLFTAPLAFLPNAACAAILASSAIDLFDLSAFRRLARVGRYELAFALVAAAGVIWIGVLPGITVAVGATMAHLLQLAAKPKDTLLGRRHDGESYASVRADPTAKPVEGLVIYLFEAPLLFFNADYFRHRALVALSSCKNPRWFVLDATPMGGADTDAVEALTWLADELARREIGFALTGAHGRFRRVMNRSGLARRIGHDRIFSDVAAAVAAIEAGRPPASTPAAPPPVSAPAGS